MIIVSRKVDLNTATFILRRSRHDLHNSSYHTEHHSIIVKYHDLAYFAHEHICTCQDEDCDPSFQELWSIFLWFMWGPRVGRQKLLSRLYFKSSCGVLAGFYLGFIVWGRSPEWPKATSRSYGGPGACSPGNFLKWICAEMQSGAFWDPILRNVTVVFYFIF